ncbi:MAG: MBL fold metallo-hydrolase [Candidatus Latescibacterota bacterium]|nr:MAG: MBL fold metallo-hydrolase [Candidatus Latescibacterota bacterium]
MIELTFLGAAGTVTGSKTLLRVGDDQLLVDCGLFQGLKQLRLLNWQEPEWDPGGVAWLLLTHAHIDHSGFLPRLGRYGFRGRILCTAATAELAQVLLRDSAHIQEEDAEWLNRKGLSKHKPALPLYDRNDVERILRRFEVRDYDSWFHLGKQVRARFRNAGHIIGSATVEVEIASNARTRRILWSGDVGRFDMPLNPDPAPPEAADYVIIESTYGDRTHPAEPPLASMQPLLERMLEKRSILLVPAFAVGRAQQIIYMARELITSGRLPAFPVYLDSPMAVDATEIYCRYPDHHTLPDDKLMGDGCVLYGPNVHLVRSVEASKRLNALEGPALLISSSGMLSGGRVLHHLKRLLPDRRCTIALVGYQAIGTRGRALQEGAETLKIHGQHVPVRARVEDLGSLSGHADHTELLRWLSPVERKPQRVFVTHGEEQAAEAFAAALHSERGWESVVPTLGERFALD